MSCESVLQLLLPLKENPPLGGFSLGAADLSHEPEAGRGLLLVAQL